MADFKELFVEVVRLAGELGLAHFGKLSIDGTKVRANASKRKAMSYGRMAEEERRLTEEIEALLKEAGEADAAEDARLGADVRGDELPVELRRRKTGWRRSLRPIGCCPMDCSSYCSVSSSGGVRSQPGVLSSC